MNTTINIKYICAEIKHKSGLMFFMIRNENENNYHIQVPKIDLEWNSSSKNSENRKNSENISSENIDAVSVIGDTPISCYLNFEKKYDDKFTDMSKHMFEKIQNQIHKLTIEYLK